MYNIFYIYTYKYTIPSNTLTLSRHKCPYKPRTHKQPNEPHKQEQAASRVYMSKMHKPHNAPSHTIGNLHICGDSEKLHNAFYVSVLSLFVTTLKMFCNSWEKWARVCGGN